MNSQLTTYYSQKIIIKRSIKSSRRQVREYGNIPSTNSRQTRIFSHPYVSLVRQRNKKSPSTTNKYTSKSRARSPTDTFIERTFHFAFSHRQRAAFHIYTYYCFYIIYVYTSPNHHSSINAAPPQMLPSSSKSNYIHQKKYRRIYTLYRKNNIVYTQHVAISSFLHKYKIIHPKGYDFYIISDNPWFFLLFHVFQTQFSFDSLLSLKLPTKSTVFFPRTQPRSVFV